MLLKYFVLIILIFFYSLSSNGNSNIIEELKKNNKLIFIRHALAPGNGDPDNFDLSDCSTQRNLNATGILQSFKIGQFFIDNEIVIDNVYSSQWCRCKDTASFAFINFEELSYLNSFYSHPFILNKDTQMKDLKKFIFNLKSTNNVVFVTHYVVIAELINYFPESGEIIEIDKNMNILNTFKIK